jgi:hypothetical protein
MRIESRTRGFSILALTLGLTALPAAPACAQAPKVGDPPDAKNMRLVGFNDLQARSAYQPIIQKQGDRYIAYVGHHGGTRAIPRPVNPLTGQAESVVALRVFLFSFEELIGRYLRCLSSALDR